MAEIPKHLQPLPEAELAAIFAEARNQSRKAGYPEHPTDHRICHCGTCQDAFEHGLRIAEELIAANNCGLFLYAVGTAVLLSGHTAISRMISNNPMMLARDFSQAETNMRHLDERMTDVSGHAENLERAWRTIEAEYIKHFNDRPAKKDT